MKLYQMEYLLDTLHSIAQGLLIPTIGVIFALIMVTVFFIGQVIMEFFSERRHFKQNMSKIVNIINDATFEELPEVAVNSKLLVYQKSALVTVSKNMGLPEEPLFALAQNEINNAEKIYKKRLAWTDVIAKVAPMLGLMGTLIPLGPGIAALGKGDNTALAHSLLLAFDATVCGLVCAILALVISKIRSGWYAEYINVLESIMSCVIDKATQARSAGLKLSTNYTEDPIKEIVESKPKFISIFAWFKSKIKPKRKAKQNKNEEEAQ